MDRPGHLRRDAGRRVHVQGGGPSKWHAANLGWPVQDSAWPTPGGENDYMEMQLDGGLGAFFHVLGGGSHGEGQIHFSAPDVDITQWFTVGFEVIAGKSYRWLVNGKYRAPDNSDELKRTGALAADGITIAASKVPN